MDDALVCLYQNGERMRPSNGYPVRLLVPGFEGNHERQMAAPDQADRPRPAMAKDETSKYTIVLKDEKAWQFVFPMEVKSLITRPAPGITLKGPGFYEISGLAWSGNGSIKQVDVSADGGKSWAPAALSGPILPMAPVRFRAPWQWNGGPAVLQSRATDDTGMVQPTRAQFAAERGLRGVYHYNAIASWAHRCEGGGDQCVRLNLSRSASRRLPPSPAALAQTPQFGQPISPADIAPWDISIGPDGVGLPPGRGTAAQGEAIYAAKCQACHGEKGTGKPNDRAGRRHGLARAGPGADEDGRQLLALCHDAVRLCAAGDAVPGVAIAHQRRALRGVGLHPASQRDRGPTTCSTRSRCQRCRCRTGTDSFRSRAIRNSDVHVIAGGSADDVARLHVRSGRGADGRSHDHKIAVRGCSIKLMRGGPGAPLLFLHGASGAGAWLPFMASLAERFDVIVPEHPGFGESDTPDWLDTIHDLAYFYLDLLAQLDLDRVHLVGVSLGGWIAAELAVRDSSRLASLTLADAAGIHVPGADGIDTFLRSDEQRIRDFFHDQARAEEMIARILRPELEDVAMKNRIDDREARLAAAQSTTRICANGCTGSTCRRLILGRP